MCAEVAIPFRILRRQLGTGHATRGGTRQRYKDQIRLPQAAQPQGNVDKTALSGR
jgi:hypothetical protein